MGILHKHVRRLIVWARSPSDEEVAQQVLDAKAMRRKRLARNVRNALRNGKHYSEWCRIGAADSLIGQARVDDLIAYLEPCTHMQPSKNIA